MGFIVSFFIDNYVKKSKKVLLFIFDFFCNLAPLNVAYCNGSLCVKKGIFTILILRKIK